MRVIRIKVPTSSIEIHAVAHNALQAEFPYLPWSVGLGTEAHVVYVAPVRIFFMLAESAYVGCGFGVMDEAYRTVGCGYSNRPSWTI